VRTTEQNTKTPSATTGFFAMLCGSLPTKGTIASSRAPRALVLLTIMAGVLACSSSSALALKTYVPGVSFGSEGSGNGQFKEPAGVAVNDSPEPLTDPAAGDVYVVDEGNDRVERFSATGAYLGQFNGSGTYEDVEEAVKVKTGAAVPTGAFSSPQWIAVDNSTSLTDPSAGDVYVTDNGHNVIDKFSPTGEYLGQLTGVIPFNDLRGVAVTSSGDLWVLGGEAKGGQSGQLIEQEFDEFSDTDIFVKSFRNELSVAEGLAVDSHENLYTGYVAVLKYDSASGESVGTVGTYEEYSGHKSVRALAVNPSTNNVLVDTGAGIALYGPFGEPYETPPLETFPNEQHPGKGLSESYGLAVNTAGTAYASERAAGNVESFDYVPLPGVSTQAVSGVSEIALTLHGSVATEGEEVKECYFEYGTEPGVYTNKVACSPAAPFSGAVSSVPVSAQLSGLPPGNPRSFRLVAVNANGTAYTHGVAISRPVITGESFSGVGSVAATASAQIDAGGLPTSFHVEYGTSTSYGTSTPGESVGSVLNENVGARVNLSGLQAGTPYHFRVVASNALGTTLGADVAFTTFPPPTSGLPDGRVYEPVSPEGSDQDVEIYIPNSNKPLSGFGEHGIWANISLPFEVAADGEAVVYAGDPPPATGGTGEAGDGSGNEYLATRAAEGGWTQVALESIGIQAQYEAFSSDLSTGILQARAHDEAYNPIPGTGAPAGYPDLYAHATASGAGGEYRPFSAVTPDRPLQELVTQESAHMLYAGANGGTSAVPASTHLLFESNAGLLEGEGKLETELGEDVEREVKEGKSSILVHYLYDSVGGRAHLVDVLPDGEVAPGAAFGSLEAVHPSNGTDEGEVGGPGFTHVISADGSRVFWTAAPEAHEQPGGGLLVDRSKALYVRENDTQPQSPVGPEDECLVAADACTVQVDAAVGGGGIFQGASTDGSKVFFTKGDLYEYDLNTGETTDLSPGVEVKGVAGISENSEYVYYIDAKGDIDLWHGGLVTRIATEAADFDDYAEEIGTRTAEVTPDGQSLLFTSSKRLTGYDNELLEEVAGERGGFVETSLVEVFLYEAQSGKLTCVSCNPTGEAVVPTKASTVYDKNNEHYTTGFVGALLPQSHEAAYQPQILTADGARVFFESAEPLVPQADNGYLDVYEWERDGTGSCTDGQGCIYLLSNGTNPENSYLVGADATGENVFFVTRAQLVPADRNDLDDLYDARVGGVQPPAAPACSGSGCQGVPPTPPIFATPASATFNGVGNFPPPSPPAPTKTTKKTVKCPKGKKHNKHDQCVKVKTEHKKANKASRATNNRRVSR
jgi:hypothetical protein